MKNFTPKIRVKNKFRKLCQRSKTGMFFGTVYYSLGISNNKYFLIKQVWEKNLLNISLKSFVFRKEKII